MISKEEVRELLKSTETYRIERTTSTGDMDKFQEAICAFSNDLPNSKKNGYLILGAYDNGTLSGLKVDDDLLKKISAIRSNGNILPLPFPVQRDSLSMNKAGLSSFYPFLSSHSWLSEVSSLHFLPRRAYLTLRPDGPKRVFCRSCIYRIIHILSLRIFLRC